MPVLGLDTGQPVRLQEKSGAHENDALGTGDVGKAIGKAFVILGHDVKMGARSATNEKAVAWVKEMGAKESAGKFADAASNGEIVVLATRPTGATSPRSASLRSK